MEGIGGKMVEILNFSPIIRDKMLLVWQEFYFIKIQ